MRLLLILPALLILIGCNAPGVDSSPAREGNPPSSPTIPNGAKVSSSPTARAEKRTPTPRATWGARPSLTASPTPASPAAVATAILPSDVPQPSPLPGGFSVAPNWLAFQPMKANGYQKANVFWFTDGQRWIGPFSPRRELDLEFLAKPIIKQQDGIWYGCLQGDPKGSGRSDIECFAPLPGEPPTPRRVLEAQCQGPISTATVRCALPPEMPVQEVEVPNPWWNKGNPCGGYLRAAECRLVIRIQALAGDSALLAEVDWETDWGEQEAPPLPRPELFVLEPAKSAARILIPPEERKEVALWNARFSPDGRFLLVDDLSPMADEHTLWIVRWPDGQRVALPGVGQWVVLQPKE